MADKKEYSPEEVAKAILEKCTSIYKSEVLAKANTSHELETGAEPNNDDAECPEQLASDGTSLDSGDKKKKKQGDIADADEDSDGDIDGSDALEEADKDEDGDIDGDDAIEAKEEESGEDLDGDGEAGESEQHEEKAEAPKDEKKDEKKDKKMPFQKSERPLKSFMEKRSKKTK